MIYSNPVVWTDDGVACVWPCEMGIKKEQPTEFDGLSEKRKALMQFAMEVPEDKAEMILQVMRTILKND